MTFNSGAGKEFLGFYLDPELLNEEEAKICLGDLGVNLESVDQKLKEYEKKIETMHLKVLDAVVIEAENKRGKCSGKLCTV